MTGPRRADPAEGVFETSLIAAGEPIELSAHLSRLGRSVAQLYGLPLPRSLAEEARERSRHIELGRLRIVVAPTDAGLTHSLAAEPIDPADHFPAWERGAGLTSVPCPGGLGRHKWADRRRIPPLPDGALALLVDEGEVLEAARANVFAVLGGTLVTPPDDGRILPGIARAAALAAARKAELPVAERPLRHDDLLRAEEVFLTGSVRGVEPARSLDDTPLSGPGETSRQIAAAVRRRWLGEPAPASLPARDSSPARAPAGAPPAGPPAR